MLKISTKTVLVVTYALYSTTQIAKFMGPTWDPSGSCWLQMGPMLAPWTLLSGCISHKISLESLQILPTQAEVRMYVAKKRESYTASFFPTVLCVINPCILSQRYITWTYHFAIKGVEKSHWFHSINQVLLVYYTNIAPITMAVRYMYCCELIISINC